MFNFLPKSRFLLQKQNPALNYLIVEVLNTLWLNFLIQDIL